MENNEISIGEADFESSSNGENIEVVSDGNPSARKAPLYSSAWNGSNKINPGGSIFTVTGNDGTGGGNHVITSTLLDTKATAIPTVAATAYLRFKSNFTYATDELRENVAPLPYSFNSIATYLLVLFTTYFI